MYKCIFVISSNKSNERGELGVFFGEEGICVQIQDDSGVMTKKRQKKEKRTDHSTNNVRRKKVLSLTMTNLMTHGKPTMVEVGIAQIIFIHLGHATHDGIPHY